MVVGVSFKFIRPQKLLPKIKISHIKAFISISCKFKIL